MFNWDEGADIVHKQTNHHTFSYRHNGQLFTKP